MKPIQTLVFACAGLALTAIPAAEAQRSNGAPIAQGITTGDIAATVDRLRSANAEALSRIADLEAERAQTIGRIETLEFLLSESNDEINRLNVENVEVGKRLREYEDNFEAMEARIASLEEALQRLTYSGGYAGEYVGEYVGEGDVGTEGEPLPPGVVRRTEIDPDGNTRTVWVRTVTVPEEGSGLPEGTLGQLPASQLPGEAGALFTEAKNRLLRFDYDGAQVAFQSFLTQFGNDPQAAEAQYWLGEVYYQQGAYPESGQAFTEMLRKYPDDERAPVALVKLARSLRLIGETENACKALATLPKRYPDASPVTQNIANVERVRSACDG